MEIRPTHSMRFECEDENALPEVRNPSYIYKVGDKITMEDMYAEEGKSLIGKFEVIDIEHKLFSSFDGDQEAVVFLKRLKE